MITAARDVFKSRIYKKGTNLLHQEVLKTVFLCVDKSDIKKLFNGYNT